MPEETATAEPTEEIREFGTPLAEIFDRKMPIAEEDALPPEKKAEAPAKPEPKVEIKAEKKEPEPKKEVKPRGLPDSLFKTTEDEPVKPKTDEKTELPEPVKEEVPENLKGEARKNFERLSDSKFQAEKKAFTAEKKSKELETKLTEAEGKLKSGDPDAKARIQQLEGQLQQWSGIIEQVNIEAHPWFQANFTVPKQQILEGAKTVYQEVGGNPDELEAALSLKGKTRVDKLEALLEEIPSKMIRGKIERAADQLETIDGKRTELLKNKAGISKQLQAEEQVNRSRMVEQIEREVRSNLVDAEKTLRDEFKLEVFKTVDDPNYQWWNDEIKQSNERAEHIMLKTSDPKELAIAAHLAARFPVVRTLWLEERAARVAAEVKLAKYEDTEPSLGGKGKSSENGSEDDDEKKSISSFILGSIKREGKNIS